MVVYSIFHNFLRHRDPAVRFRLRRPPSQDKVEAKSEEVVRAKAAQLNLFPDVQDGVGEGAEDQHAVLEMQQRGSRVLVDICDKTKGFGVAMVAFRIRI